MVIQGVLWFREKEISQHFGSHGEGLLGPMLRYALYPTHNLLQRRVLGGGGALLVQSVAVHPNRRQVLGEGSGCPTYAIHDKPLGIETQVGAGEWQANQVS